MSAEFFFFFFNLQNWMRDKEEVQLVDMVLRIRNKLAEASDQKLPISEVIVEQLNKHIDTILKALPQDLQLVLDTDKTTTAPAAVEPLSKIVTT